MLDQKTVGTSGAFRLADGGGGVGILEIDVPGRPVNILTSAVLADLESVLAAVAGDPAVKALVVTGARPAPRRSSPERTSRRSAR